MSDVADRRLACLERLLAEADEEKLARRATGLWPVNHARLVLGRDLDAANRYFETVEYDTTPRLWKDGKRDTRDWDFLGIAVLRTLLDFRTSDRLTDAAKENLTGMIVNWQQPRVKSNRNNDRVAVWPEVHTENHDLMCLTIGCFRELLAGRDAAGHVGHLCRSLAWRFERGWWEWHSPVYQVHYLNPLLVLARHAPSPVLRQGAADLIQLQLAERALLSVGGYLGGPFRRGYAKQIADDRNDFYLPVMWMAFGLGDGGSGTEGAAFASHDVEPHPVVAALAEEAARRPALHYRGTRHHGVQCLRRMICYYNTPHVSMGSIRASAYGFQSRFCNVLFPAEPGKSLRTYLRDPEHWSPWDEFNSRGELAQHAGWMVSRGELIAEGGLTAERVGHWDLYAAGRGLCAHAELSGGWHVFQVGDLDRWGDAASFAGALHMPRHTGSHITGRTADGDEAAVSLADMALHVNGRASDWLDMLHDSPELRSAYGRGRVTVNSAAGALRLSCEGLVEQARAAGVAS
jgi:hypothetical protein